MAAEPLRTVGEAIGDLAEHRSLTKFGSTQCLREYSRLALCGLLRFSRAPSQQGVHNNVRSTAFNPFEYRHGSARRRFGE